MRKSILNLVVLVFFILIIATCKPTISTSVKKGNSSATQSETKLNASALGDAPLQANRVAVFATWRGSENYPDGFANGGKKDERLEVNETKPKKGGELELKEIPENWVKPATNIIEIDPTIEYQTMLGIGAGLTGATVANINILSAENQEKIWEAYFGDTGSRYCVIRTSIGSCDFSMDDYDYCHHPTEKVNESTIPIIRVTPEGVDLDTSYFKIQPDIDNGIIPAIKKIQSYVPNLKVFSAPWSAPAWMKAGNKRRGHGGSRSMTKIAEWTNEEAKPHMVKAEYYKAYATYFAEFVRAYKKHGIPIYSISMQNETQAWPGWETGLWTQDQTKAFVKELGPALDKVSREIGIAKPKLLIWDFNRSNPSYSHDGFLPFNRGVLSDAEAKQYIDGIAYHWYGTSLIIAGGSGDTTDEFIIGDWGVLKTIQSEHPEMTVYPTEACQEMPVIGDTDLYKPKHWFPAARYAYDIINSFNVGAPTWIDWNMVLTSEGLPTHHIKNTCHAPIMIDYKQDVWNVSTSHSTNSTNGNLIPVTEKTPNDTSDDEMIMNPAYYVLKRISNEVRPGSKRIEAKVNVPSGGNPTFHATAMKAKDGTISLLVCNINPRGPWIGKEKTFTVKIGNKYFEATVPGHSFTAYRFKL